MTNCANHRAYEQLRQEHHPDCVVCGQRISNGLGLQFQIVEAGVVEATIACRNALQGYPDILHGGAICSILDGAMTNCVFAAGIPAVTGDLYVRFLRPVAACGQAKVRAWIEASCGPLYRLVIGIPVSERLVSWEHNGVIAQMMHRAADFRSQPIHFRLRFGSVATNDRVRLQGMEFQRHEHTQPKWRMDG